MKYLLLFVTLLALSFPSFGKVEADITRKGQYSVFCNGELIDSHNEWQKAYETAVNQNTTCVIEQPRLEVILESLCEPQPEPVPPEPPGTGTADSEERWIVKLTWEIPTKREDGTELNPNDIKEYRIYRSSVEGSLHNYEPNVHNYRVTTIEDPLRTSAEVYEFSSGFMYYAIAAVDINGTMSALSPPSSVFLPRH